MLQAFLLILAISMTATAQQLTGAVGDLYGLASLIVAGAAFVSAGVSILRRQRLAA